MNDKSLILAQLLALSAMQTNAVDTTPKFKLVNPQPARHQGSKEIARRAKQLQKGILYAN